MIVRVINNLNQILVVVSFLLFCGFWCDMFCILCVCVSNWNFCFSISHHMFLNSFFSFLKPDSWPNLDDILRGFIILNYFVSWTWKWQMTKMTVCCRYTADGVEVGSPSVRRPSRLPTLRKAVFHHSSSQVSRGAGPRRFWSSSLLLLSEMVRHENRLEETLGNHTQRAFMNRKVSNLEEIERKIDRYYIRHGFIGYRRSRRRGELKRFISGGRQSARADVGRACGRWWDLEHSFCFRFCTSLMLPIIDFSFGTSDLF